MTTVVKVKLKGSKPATKAGDAYTERALVAFTQAMREKLDKKHRSGLRAWRRCTVRDMARMLVEHIDKGDPVDLANFAMFIWAIDRQYFKSAGPVTSALRLALRERAADLVRSAP